MNAINLEEKLSTFSQHYQPRTVCQFNGHDVMVLKVKGPFTWHKHDETEPRGHRVAEYPSPQPISRPAQSSLERAGPAQVKADTGP